MKVDVHLLDLVFYLFSTRFIMAAVIGIFPFAVWALILAIRAHQNKVVTGKEGLIDSCGSARTDISPAGGKIDIRGEIWSAVSREKIKRGAVVSVEGIRNMVLMVRENKDDLL